MRQGRDVTGELCGRTEIFTGRKEQEPKFVEDFENTSGNSTRTSPSRMMTAGVQPGSYKSNTISCM